MSLIDLIALCKKHLKFIIALPVVLALACGIWSYTMQPDEYTAEVSIYALMRGNEESGSEEQESTNYTNLQTAQMLANDFVELARNGQIRENTARALGLQSLDDYTIDVTSSTTSRVIKLTVTGTDRKSCALVANELAEELGETAVRVMGVEAVNIINEAEVPDHPSGPRRGRSIAIAFILGLIIALIFVVVRNALDTTIHNREDAYEVLGVPVLGQLPAYERKGRR